MAHQVYDWVLRVAATVNLYQLITLALALTAAIIPLGMPGGGGGSGA